MPRGLIRKSIKIALEKISFNQSERVLLVKLAGIGDVAMACRALNDFFSTSSLALQIHWIIDKNYVKLAESLLNIPDHVQIKFCPVDSASLFQGNSIEKAKESLRLAQYVAGIQPRVAVLLHRDWRYLAFLRPFFAGSIIKLKKEPLHELDAYRIALNRLATKFDQEVVQKSPEANKVTQPPTSGTNLKIGILLGGASGTKLTYHEKKWPHFNELIRLILEKTSYEVHLYGSIDDISNFESLSKGTSFKANETRIVNHIGKLKLHELKSSIENLDRFLSIDSGLIHIASLAMKYQHQKVIGIYGPTNPSIWGPVPSEKSTVQILYKFKNCSPCYLDDGKFVPCKYTGDKFQYCMTETSASEVLSSLLP